MTNTRTLYYIEETDGTIIAACTTRTYAELIRKFFKFRKTRPYPIIVPRTVPEYDLVPR